MVAQPTYTQNQEKHDALSSNVPQKHDAFGAPGQVYYPTAADYRELKTSARSLKNRLARAASGDELSIQETSALAHRAAEIEKLAGAVESWQNWQESLSRNKALSPTSKELARALVHRTQQAQTGDDTGRMRVNIGQLADDIGVSVDTVTRNFKAQLIPSGIIASHDVKKEVNESGDIRPRWYVAPGQEVLAQPESIMLPTPINHGGKPDRSYPCAKCGNEDTKVKTHKKITRYVICPCGHESLLDENESVMIDGIPQKHHALSTPGQEFAAEECTIEHKKHDAFGNLAQQSGQNASITSLPESNMRHILKPYTPPQVAPRVSPSKKITPQVSGLEDMMQAAARLLVECAGGEITGVDSHHVEMIRNTELEKYLPARPRRMLQIGDARNHLRGNGGARAALCSYANGQARLLTFETDKEEEWPVLQQIASELAEGGYKPILEPSPAHHGGHLCIIYSELVYVAAARRTLYDASDALKELAQRPGAEYWPRGGCRVRLPGGKYSRGAVNEFCELQAIASDTRASTDRQAVAQILLENQTPAGIVSPLYIEEEIARQEEEKLAAAVGVSRRQLRQSETASECRPETVGGYAGQEVDARHKEKYQGVQLVKWGSPAYLIRRFNENHTLDSIRPRERNGKALSPIRNERTASTSYYDTPDGERWTDYGGGSRVTGDAFDLYCAPLVNDIAKKDMLRDLANELKEEARQALENAARSGQDLPAWIQEIITPAGQVRYTQLREQSGHASTVDNVNGDNESRINLIYYINSEEQPVAARTETAIEESTGGVTGLKPTTLDLWGFATVLRVGDWVPMPDRPEAGPAQIVNIADSGDYTVLYFGNLRTYDHAGALLNVVEKCATL